MCPDFFNEEEKTGDQFYNFCYKKVLLLPKTVKNVKFTKIKQLKAAVWLYLTMDKRILNKCECSIKYLTTCTSLGVVQAIDFEK